MSESGSGQSKPPFADVRRVVTGHTLKGEATVILDEVKTPHNWPPNSLNPVHNLYQSNESPARNDAELLPGGWVDDVDNSRLVRGTLVRKQGSTFRSFDLAPGSASPFHRTHSLDYGIVIHGNVVLELDNGKRIPLKEGDTVIQRGTMHSWRNESTEWARLYFVLLDAHPILVDEEILPQEWRKPIKPRL